MAPKERTELMVGAKGIMPSPAFQTVMELVRNVLSATEYMRLKEELGP
jgi:hypothetical protein